LMTSFSSTMYVVEFLMCFEALIILHFCDNLSYD